MSFPFRLILLSIFATTFFIGCSAGRSGNPVTPSDEHEGSQALSQPANADTASHFLWGYYLVRIDEHSLSAEVVPIRATAGHVNVLKFLEQGPCSDCLKLGSITPNPDGSLNVSVSLKHPFLNAIFTGFDVRGIAMFGGSHLFPASGLVMSDRTLGEGELLNAQGYTTLFNPTTAGHGLEGYIKGKLATKNAPTATVNGFRRFVSSGAYARNAFYAGAEVTETYKIDMPDPPNPWVFGYAVDACWEPPIKKPVEDPITDFPPSANCPEPYAVYVYELGPGVTPDGGSTILKIDVYDWQGTDTYDPPTVECPELFDGFLTATLTKDEGYGSHWRVQIENPKLAGFGTYKCLIAIEDHENNPASKPWLDLTAYAEITIRVTEFHPIDITPPWLDITPGDVCVDGNYAYTVGGANGLHIFDISDPANPVWVNWMETPGEARGVAVSGGLAYVADGSLDIIDVEPPQSASIVGSVDMHDAQAVAVSGGYAYVADGGSGLEIVDVDPPESAHIVKTVATVHTAAGVAASGGYAYVADYNAGFYVIDVDPPESAHIVQSVGSFSYANRVVISGGYAYVADSWGLRIIDIDPPESAYIVKLDQAVSGAEGVAVSGSYAYVANLKSGLQIVDVSVPETPNTVATVGIPDGAAGVAVSGDYAYVAAWSTGLHVVDINPPESAAVVHKVETLGGTTGAAVSAGMAYVTRYGGDESASELKIVDLDPLSSASIINSVPTPGETTGLALSAGYAYVTDGPSGGFQIVDVEPPGSAYIVKSLDTAGESSGVALSGSYAYVADGIVGLNIISIEPPESAYIVNLVGTSGDAKEVAVSGGYAYVISGELQIINIDPPESAHIVNSVGVPINSNTIAASGGYAYVVSDKLQIFDIDPPESAYLVESVDLPETAQGVAVDGSYAYVADYQSGIQIVDIDPPESAHLIKSIGMTGDAWGITISGNIAYVANRTRGLRIIQLY